MSAVDDAPRHKERGESIGHWMHLRRKSEVTQETVNEILEMTAVEGLEAVSEMHEKKQWIRQINNASVMIPIMVETLTDRRGFTLEVLLDCGVTGCYIDKGFALAKNLPMDCLPRPIPVYNADGSHNEGGPITHTMTL